MVSGMKALGVALSILSALPFLVVSPDVTRAQEGLPDGASTFTSSPDEVVWRPFFFAEVATVYRGANGYAVDLIRIQPDKEILPNVSLAHLVGLHAPYGEEAGTDRRHAINAVIRVQTGTLYLALSEAGATVSGHLVEYYPYGPGSVIVLPAGIKQRMFAGGEGVVLEVTHPQNIAH